ncbi:hypothetical protein LDENG_00170760 [Lucifuga dentata]|nr:hypothetical protein LDENG_00170760 [Lucifuga dentata]
MYLDILDSAFGTVEDGDDLYAKFLNTLQNYGEKSSVYLQQLQVMLNTTLSRGGVNATDLDSQLLKQFCRGCWDNTLISELKLEQKKHSPPTFAELLLLLRTEEDKCDSKACRMKQHFGASRQKVSSHFHSAYAQCAGECSTSPQRHILIGTNTLDVLYELYSSATPQNLQSLPYSYRVVLKTLEMRQRQKVDSCLGVVRIFSKDPEIIGPGQTKVVEGSVNCKAPDAGKWVAVESPKISSLPGGIMVTNGLASLPPKLPRCIPVILNVKPLTTDDSHILTQPDQTPKNNFDFGDSPISNEWKERITVKLNSMPDVFSQHKLDFGRTDKIKHHIKLSDETPFKHKVRRIHPQDIEAVRKHLQELLDAEIIRESESPFFSPIVVIRKKNSDVRLCIDYRKFNLQTVKDSYALPNLEESFSALNGSKWFSVLDLKSGFYQIEMEESGKYKTGFVCPLGFVKFNRMPQGITNVPSTFQRLMEHCIGELNLKQALVFMDDLIIFSPMLEEHEERLLNVLNRLREYGLKLSPDKCKFFQTSVKYLSHIVSIKGIETDPEKIATLKPWQKPNNLKELRTFLGFCSYYRRFIKDHAKIVKPLNVLSLLDTRHYGSTVTPK